MKKVIIPGSVWGQALPLLPLRDLVILPGTTAPLLVGRSRSITAVERAHAAGGLIMLSTQKSS
ncbi:MAG: hypothetical protein OEZ04_09215, partial [Nitrospinota bacterium]|nr:hypothetical protein [Nitrospinota bacterium]